MAIPIVCSAIRCDRDAIRQPGYLAAGERVDCAPVCIAEGLFAVDGPDEGCVSI
jgi:hypothetical protein